MSNQLRPYRSGMLTKAMTEQEVAALAAASKDYFTGDLSGRRPAFTRKLTGKTLVLRFDNGGPYLTHRFTDEHTLLWKYENGAEREEYYEAFEIDDQIFMIAYLRRNSRPATSCTCVVDLKMNLSTLIVSAMGTRQSARDIDQRVYHGVVERDGLPTPYVWRHHPTRDLTGRSMGWSYRDDMTSQHIFGSPHSISWVILQGPGTGLLGSAPCKYFKISDHVYLYTWLETMGSGQQGVVLMNLKTMHDCGTFYGINHNQRFEFYTYGARGYSLGSYETKDRFVW
ncbi:MAG TPA: MoaF N-terminal domain-containing protein [Candidatus Limiplasma sp.]|nr:MoaF N-terminal domain-containing protein [Candidatus Limiplasma sp.]HPR78325.1 MoaF N-terminal domain-containing protein [Candidatus Limiplasma sp.]